MIKDGAITERTPDVEQRANTKEAAADKKAQIRELDNDVSKRLADKAQETLQPK